jgi:hypothetical protein
MEVIITQSKYSPGNLSGGTWGKLQDLSQDSLCASWDSNCALPEYELEVIQLCQPVQFQTCISICHLKKNVKNSKTGNICESDESLDYKYLCGLVHQEHMLHSLYSASCKWIMFRIS